MSLILIYAPTGNANLRQPKPEIMSLLMAPPVTGRDAFVEQRINAFRILSGSGFPLDEEWFRKVGVRGYDRSHYPDGMGRHILAGFVRGNRQRVLPSVTAPTLVIHGDEDPLVPVENRSDTGRRIDDHQRDGALPSP